MTYIFSRSSRKVPLNVWHRVNIARNNRHGSLIVNGGIPVEGDSKGNLNELNLGETIFIGGHPSEYNRNVGIGRGLSGAVQKVVIVEYTYVLLYNV